MLPVEVPNTQYFECNRTYLQVGRFRPPTAGHPNDLLGRRQQMAVQKKEHGMVSATASFGLILLGDVDGGLTPIDKYLYSNENYIKSGALLACGIINCGIRNEVDPALALLSDYELHQNRTMRVGAILGLGLAYADSNRSVVLEQIGSLRCRSERSPLVRATVK